MDEIVVFEVGGFFDNMLHWETAIYLLIRSVFSTFLYYIIITKLAKVKNEKIVWISSLIFFVLNALIVYYTLFVMFQHGAFATFLIYSMRYFSTAGWFLAIYMFWRKLSLRKR